MWPQVPFYFGGWGGQTPQARGGLLSRRPQRMPGMPPQQIGAPQPLDTSSLMPQLPGLSMPGGPRQPTPMAPAPIDFQAPNMAGLDTPLPATPSLSKPSFGQQANNWIGDNRMPLMMAGLQLLDGQGYGAAGNTFMGVKDWEQQRADQGEDREFQRGERDRLTEERARSKAEYDRILADPTVAPDVKAAVRAAGPAGLPEILGTQVMSASDKARIEFEASRAKTQDQQFRLQFEQGKREFAATQALGYERLNTDRFLNSQLQSLGRDEASYVAGMRTKLDTGREIMANVGELQRYLKEYPDIWGSLLEATPEAAVRKFARGDQSRIAAIQRIYAIGANLARDELKGQAPVSNVDLLSAIRSNPNTQSVRPAVEAWINQTTSEYQGAEQRFQSALNHLSTGGSLYTPDPKTGRSWYQENYQGVSQPRDPSIGGPGIGGGAPPAPPRTAETLPPPRGLAEGTKATDTQTGRQFVIRSGQWVAETTRNPRANVLGGRTQKPGTF